MSKSDVKARLEMRLEYLGRNDAKLALKDIKNIDAALAKSRALNAKSAGLSVEKAQAIALRGAMNTQKAVAVAQAKAIEARKTQELKASGEIAKADAKRLEAHWSRLERLNIQERKDKEKSKLLASRNEEKAQREKEKALKIAEREEERNRKRREKMLLGEAREKARFEKQMLKDIERDKRRQADTEIRGLKAKIRLEESAARDAKRRAKEKERELRKQFKEEKRILTELKRIDKDRANARKEFYGRVSGSVGRTSAATGAALVGTGAAAIDAHLGMSKGVTSVLTLNTDLSEKQINELAKSTMRNYGFDTDTTTKAMYDITSSGFGKDGQLQPVLEAASKLAVGGNTDISSAASGLVATLNAWDLGADKANDVTDLFFQAMVDGSTTIEQLSDNMGKIGAMAKLTNISIPEVFSFVDLATKTGTKTETAVTGTSQMISSIIQNKDNKKSKAAARKLGVKLGAKGLSETPGGLAGWMDTVLRSEHYSVDLLKDIFTDIDGFRVAASLARFGPDEIQKMLASQSGATKGQATKIAFDKIANSDAFQAQQIYSDLHVSMIELGEVLVPIVKEYLPGLKEGLAEWHEELKDPAVRELIANLMKYGLLLSAGGLVMSGTISFIRNIREVSSALSTMLGRGGKLDRDLLSMRSNLNGTSLALGGSDGLNQRIKVINSALAGKGGVSDNLKYFGGTISGTNGIDSKMQELRKTIGGQGGVTGKFKDLSGGLPVAAAALVGLALAAENSRREIRQLGRRDRSTEDQYNELMISGDYEGARKLASDYLQTLAEEAEDYEKSPIQKLFDVLKGTAFEKLQAQDRAKKEWVDNRENASEFIRGKRYQEIMSEAPVYNAFARSKPEFVDARYDPRRESLWELEPVLNQSLLPVTPQAPAATIDGNMTMEIIVDDRRRPQVSVRGSGRVMDFMRFIGPNMGKVTPD